jgi:gamma-glutamyltranspeptidase/glutathione hydrolase
MPAGWPAQEAVQAPQAMVASVNPLASAAGLDILRRGGNAVDAALGMGAVLTVVEPWSGQLGGDGFLLIAEPAKGQVTAINGSGAAPAAATLERYEALGSIPESGWLASSVPGLVDAWQVAAERLGSWPLARLLEPAVTYAEGGIPLTGRQANSIAHMSGAMTADSRVTFLPGGTPLRAGARLVQRDLARTFRTLQAEGATAFYRGSIAERIVAAAAAEGGLIGARDLAEHRTLIQEPLRMPFRHWTIVEQPPVSQGIVVLIALGILEQFDLHQASPADQVHLQVEAHKLAMADRISSLGDPRFADVPVAELLAPARLRKRAQLIDRRKAHQAVPEPAAIPDTTYACVVDSRRMAVSYIHSLYGGSGVMVPGTGILLNNRMAGFSLDRNSPNCLAPGKRPVHTLNSWMVLDGDRLRYLGGTPGAFWQVQTNLQVLSQLLELESGLRAAVDAPRWTIGAQTGWSDMTLSLEGRFGPEVVQDLRQRGHVVVPMGDWAAGGSVQAIELRPDGMLAGAGDPRPATSAVLGY